MTHSIPRPLQAVLIYAAFFTGMFLLGRMMHRKSDLGPEKRTWQEDALHAMWMAWLFAAMAILQLFRPHASLREVFALAVGVALPLGVPHWLYRRKLAKAGGGTLHG